MSNKEKARELINKLSIRQESLRNALHWEYSDKEIKYITDQIKITTKLIIDLVKD